LQVPVDAVLLYALIDTDRRNQIEDCQQIAGFNDRFLSFRPTGPQAQPSGQIKEAELPQQDAGTS